MTDIPEIPEQTTVRIPRVCRAAMSSLLKAVPPDYAVQDLLDLIVAKGLCQVLHGRELPPIPELEKQAKGSVPVGSESISKGKRVASDFIGFQIDETQQAALRELEDRYPLLDDEEMGRILLDCALRALPNDDLAQQRLGDSFTSWFAEEGGKP